MSTKTESEATTTFPRPALDQAIIDGIMSAMGDTEEHFTWKTGGNGRHVFTDLHGNEWAVEWCRDTEEGLGNSVFAWLMPYGDFLSKMYDERRVIRYVSAKLLGWTDEQFRQALEQAVDMAIEYSQRELTSEESN